MVVKAVAQLLVALRVICLPAHGRPAAAAAAVYSHSASRTSPLHKHAFQSCQTQRILQLTVSSETLLNIHSWRS